MAGGVRSIAGFFVMLFWTFFWLLNGLDKFFNAPGFFGRDWAPEFGEMFETLGLSGLATPAMYGVAVFEVALGVAFLIVLFTRASSGQLLSLAYGGIFVLFSLFIVGNILVGAGDEMLEHITYIILAVVTFELVLMPRSK